ncbi:hypothetical protein, partial [Streptomyces sp. bgisy100]|uniref:hypothetical protein n=1 Tax=Streptomyces sp. bgisy100 TaxID=3413783 RepID=UPI003D75ADCF
DAPRTRRTAHLTRVAGSGRAGPLESRRRTDVIAAAMRLLLVSATAAFGERDGCSGGLGHRATGTPAR